MKNIKLTTFALSTLVTFTSLSACMFNEERPEGAAVITEAEVNIVETMQTEGKSEDEIIDALVAYDKEQSHDNVIEVIDPDVAESVDPYEITNSQPAAANAGNQSITTANSTTTTTQATITIPGGMTIPSTKPISNTKPNATTPTPTLEPDPYIPTDKPKSDEHKFLTDAEDEVITYINALRKEEAISSKYTWYLPIVKSKDVMDKLHIRCEEIAISFSHKSASGTSVGSECIYQGSDFRYWSSSQIAESVFNCWKNSAGHKAGLLGGCIAGDQRWKSVNAGVGILMIDGHVYAVYGQGSNNEGTPPSTGYVLKENEHMHHYDTYVRSVKYDGCWHDVYSCSCGKELTWTVDADPCTLHYDGQHEWSEPLDCSHYSYKDGSPCCVCLRCGAKGPLWKSLPDPTPTPKPTAAPEPTNTPAPESTEASEPSETTPAPAETTAQPTEPQDPCANGHDWEFTGWDDDYDFFRCTRCGAEKAERYYE